MPNEELQTIEQQSTSTSSQWTLDFLFTEFQKESDRAAVILAASLIDDSLTQLLKSYFVPNPATRDELFDGPTSPLSNFSAKITLAFRLGLISAKLCRDLHIIRAIRNDFAHNIYGSSFEDGSVKSRIQALRASAIFAQRRKPGALMPATPRGDFLYIAGGMLFIINFKRDHVKALTQASESGEFVYAEQLDQ